MTIRQTRRTGGIAPQIPVVHAIGDDYVEQAFLGGEVLDAHPEWDIKLYYNDYNLDNQNNPGQFTAWSKS